MFFVILFLICLFVILIFSFPKFSPIPYFPTNHKDLDLIIKSFKLRNNQIIYDFGAGTGTVIFAAAKSAKKNNLNTQFIAIEINPILILIIQIKRLFHSNRKNIKVVWGDLFKQKLEIRNSKLEIVCYLYASPWLLEKIIKNLLAPRSFSEVGKKQFNNLTIISYMYKIKSLKKFEKVVAGKNKIFLYNV